MKKITVLFFMFLTSAFGYVNTDIQNGCNVDLKMIAMFVANTHVCVDGYYLPANIDECRTCPFGYSCTGGTYNFNDKEYQGAKKGSGYIDNVLSNMCAINAPKKFDAVFIRNIHNCVSGQYLPANVDKCTICPQNHYCPGGTYTFNETADQGITPCPSSTPFAPSGSAVCYPHILHIGGDAVYLKSTKLTIPSLNVGMDGQVFYANMTTIPTPMNVATEHYLKIEYNGVVYYVCDDTSFNE